jgi:hypothetical protein
VKFSGHGRFFPHKKVALIAEIRKRRKQLSNPSTFLQSHFDLAPSAVFAQAFRRTAQGQIDPFAANRL